MAADTDLEPLTITRATAVLVVPGPAYGCRSSFIRTCASLNRRQRAPAVARRLADPYRLRARNRPLGALLWGAPSCASPGRSDDTVARHALAVAAWTERSASVAPIGEHG